ncbi:Uncharacterised protein [Streptococcus pneumoniae]|nr:Uncharacterised protein [Streptococcus pneumoniae]
MTNLLFVSYSSKISSNRVNVASRQRRLAVGMVTDFVSFYATSKQCFEQPEASF